MTLPLVQTSFNAGEISPELYGEVDLKRFAAAATTMRNIFPLYRGGAMSRGGLALVGVSKQTTLLQAGSSTGPPRLINFQFSITQGYALEWGDNYLRFIFQGGYVLETGIAITGATQANPCVLSVSGTPFANGDWVFVSGVGGMTQLNGQTFIVAGVASGHFSLTDLNGANVDATAYGAYTSGGTVARLYTISTPYAAVDLPYLKFAQSADVMSLTCSNPITGTEYPPYDLTRLAAADWTLDEVDFDPVIAAPTTISAASSGLAPAGGVDAAFGYVVTSVDAKGNESVASSPVANCHGADLEVEGATNTITWGPVQGAKFYNVYRGPTLVYSTTTGYQPIPVGSFFGSVGSAYGSQYADSSDTRDLTLTPPIHQNPFAQGAILAVDITGGGSGLQTVTYTISTSTGTGFVGTPAVAGGMLGGMPIQIPGHGYQPGDSIAFNGAGFATGAVIFGSTNPSAGDTITLNGVVWTFVSALTGPNQTVVGGALSSTLSQLVADLSASGSGSLNVAAYGADTTNSNLIVTYKTAGAGGNAYTLAASRATVSGGTLAGGSGSGSAGTAATGDIAFSANPSNTQTIILDGVTWTFVTAGASGNQTNIGVSLAATLTQLASDLNASGNTSIALASYSGTSGTSLAVTYKTVGAIGNTYTLGAGTAGSGVSAATLTGGTNATSVPTATLVIGPESGTYPGVNAYFQQRHFFANSLNDPDTVWASQTGLFRNFDVAIPTDATDAITASPWTEQVNGIQWLIPMPGGLIAMTGSRAWQIIGEGSYQLNVQPITPSTTQAQPQAFNGCSATVQPIVVDYDVLYVEAIGNTTVRDLSWNFWVNIYTGADLTILSSHLFLYRQITQWTWSRLPYKVVWSACNDGTMLSMTYLKEQEVYGWARHDTQGLVVSVASVTEPPVNAIYVAVQRFPSYSPNGIYTVERMDNRLWQSVEDAYAVDSGVSNPLVSPNAALFASSLTGAVTFTATAGVFSAASVGQVIRMGGGIAMVGTYTDSKHVVGTWNLGATPGPVASLPYAQAGAWTIAVPVSTLSAPHLAGMSVVGLADGVPIGPLSVGVGPLGIVTLPFPASNVKVGLSFVAQLQTPYLNGPQVVQGGRKVINAASIRLASSANGFQYGTNQPDGAAQNPPQLGPAWSKLTTAQFAQMTGGQVPPTPYTSPGGQTVTPLWTGDIRLVGNGADWNSKGQIAVQQTLPVALEVTSVEPEMLPGDSPDNGGQRDQGGSAPSGQGPQGGGQQGPPQGFLARGPRI